MFAPLHWLSQRSKPLSKNVNFTSVIFSLVILIVFAFDLFHLMFRIVKHVLRISIYWCVDDQPPMEGLIYFKFFNVYFNVY